MTKEKLVTSIPPLEVFIFAAKDGPDAEWERAKSFQDECSTLELKSQLINKIAANLDDLYLVARYKVVSTPTIVIARGKKVLYKKLGLISARDLRDIWDFLGKR